MGLFPLMALQRLTPVHAAAYRALMLEAYALHPDAFTSSVAERAEQPLVWWTERVSEDERASDVVFGAFGGEGLLGVAGLSFETREKVRHKSTLFGMYVPMCYRHNGLGRRLVLAALDYARTRSEVEIVQLTVTEGNTPAQRLYESCGFMPFGTEPLAVRVGATYVSKVHMWCNLYSAASVER